MRALYKQNDVYGLVNAGGGGSGDTKAIDLFANQDDLGEVSGGGSASPGMQITVSANPKENSVFGYWEENDAVVTVNKKYPFTVNQNRSLKAVFMPEGTGVTGKQWVVIKPNGYVKKNTTAIRVANNKYFVYSSSDKKLAISDNGVDWTSSSLVYTLGDVIYNGSEYIVFMRNNRTVLRSPDAVTWKSGTMNESMQMSRVIINNGLYVCDVMNGYYFYKSSNAVIWTASQPTPESIYAWSFCFKDSMYHYVGTSSRDIFSSSDLVTWNRTPFPVTGGGSISFYFMTVLNDRYFISAYRDDNLCIMTSPDLENWEEISFFSHFAKPSYNFERDQVTYSEAYGLYIFAIPNNGVWYSEDLETWNQIEPSSVLDSFDQLRIASNNKTAIITDSSAKLAVSPPDNLTPITAEELAMYDILDKDDPSEE